MAYTGEFSAFEEIIKEMMMVYKHDNRPWLIGYSGGKDSSLLVSLVFEAVSRLPREKRTKRVFIVTSDTMVENPVVKRYMHSSSTHINEASQKFHLNIESHIIYPEPEQTFWSRVIGLGYPTPEPPGFRWCTDRLKIQPMNKFVTEKIEENGEIIILLGVRKDESAARNRSISAREIEGRLLSRHNDIKNAYVYNPLTEISNETVWRFLLKGDGLSPWQTDFKYLFSLYQGEDLGEEQSVLGEVDRDKIPVTGNSRFGCWCCTIVKEDKSLKNFIEKGSSELKTLLEFRNWLVSIRSNPNYRDTKKRDGTVYLKSNGEVGLGPFTLDARKIILEKLLELKRDTGMDLISMEELKVIDQMWDEEGDLSKRSLVEIYYKVFNKRLPWDKYKIPLFDGESLKEIDRIAEEYDLSKELITKVIVTVEKNKHTTKTNKMQRDFDKLMRQDWIHLEALRGELDNDNN